MLRYNEDEKYCIAKNSVSIPRKLQFSAIYGDPRNFNALEIPCLTVIQGVCHSPKPCNSVIFHKLSLISGKLIPIITHNRSANPMHLIDLSNFKPLKSVLKSEQVRAEYPISKSDRPLVLIPCGVYI